MQYYKVGLVVEVTLERSSHKIHCCASRLSYGIFQDVNPELRVSRCNRHAKRQTSRRWQ